MSKRVIQVAPRDGGWTVSCAGASKALDVAETQAQAIARGKEMAQRSRRELVVYRQDGSIRSKDSYHLGSKPRRDANGYGAHAYFDCRVRAGGGRLPR